VSREAALAARRVILVAEEIAPRARLLAEPGLILAPAFKVAAVVHQPLGAFPSPVAGCYGRAHGVYHRFHEASRSPEGTRAWLERWVLGVPDWAGFLARVEPAELAAVRAHAPGAIPDHGGRP
jgi:glutaconate CoA-transferase subunit A